MQRIYLITIGSFLTVAALLARVPDVEASLAKIPNHRLANLAALPRLKQEKPACNGWDAAKKGRYQIAIDCFQQQLSVGEQTQNRTDQANALYSLGWVDSNLGKYQQAIHHYQQALTLQQELQDQLGATYSLAGIGWAYYYLGKYQQAIDLHQQAMKIREEIQYREGIAFSLGGIGRAYSALQEYQKAIALHQEQLAIARDIKNQREEAYALQDLGTAYTALNQHQQALAAYEQALALQQNLEDHWGEGITLSFIGLVYSKLQQYTEAEKALFASIQVRESLRAQLSDLNKVSIFETQANAYKKLQEVLIAQRKVAQALEVAERGRARAFVELLASRLSPDANSPQTPTPLTIAQIQRMARDRQATLVEYSVIDTGQQPQLYIWVIQPTGELAFRQVSVPRLKGSLTDLVTQSREALGVRGQLLAFQENSELANRVSSNTQSIQLPLKQLHRLLIQPIADLLPADPTTQVIFVPQGPLFLVPFAALQDESGEYLLERHTVSTIPALQVLDLTQKQRQRLQSSKFDRQAFNILLVGNPTMPSLAPAEGEPPQPLPNLPGAAAEVAAIAPLFKTQPLTGDQATKIAVIQQMQKARIIHLATHGKADDQQGLQSWIALAPSGKDEPDNGFLTANELLELKLQAELVVLSACETGKGRITGDGVIGLSRSLISAGTPSVIVSLWQVPDSPTAFLMQKFYENLQKFPNKAQALRQAMLTTKEGFPDPQAWAAFVLIGEAQ